MDNNFNQQPKKLNVMELVALACAAVALIMTVLGSTLYCACSASKMVEEGTHSNSAVMVVAILGAIVAVVGIVFAVMALKKDGGKLSYVAMVVALFAFLYGIIPTITICGYNCSLNSASEDMAKEMATFNPLDGMGGKEGLGGFDF